MNKKTVSIIHLFLLSIVVIFAQKTEVPRCNELEETGEFQHRDLSIPNSRIVINYHDFKSVLSASSYSNKPELPLNIAYLSTKKNDTKNGVAPRFGRCIPNLLMLLNLEDTSEAKVYTQIKPINYSTKWMPHALVFSAEYKHGTSIQGLDYFYDENTLIRKIQFAGAENHFVLSGSFKGKITWKNNCIIVAGGHLRYALKFNIPESKFRIQDSTWYLTFQQRDLPDKVLYASIAFIDENEDESILLKRVSTPLAEQNAFVALSKREKYWNEFLTKVPRPLNFNLNTIDSKGVQADMLRKSYYKAWIFIAQNVLQPDQSDYPYPQICTGKAALWDEGQEKAPFSASWESLIGIQLYGMVDPKTSWNAFKGLMSLVDENGMLGGESLPSRKAQTAMVLYQQTGDTASLHQVFPALIRYMNWRIRITHWVYGNNHPDETKKDAEFVFSALIDMDYLVKIAGILHKNKAALEWQTKHDELLESCKKWFWENPVEKPYQMYNKLTGRRSRGVALWITTGLYANDWFPVTYKKSLLDLFDRDFKPDRDFSGFTYAKYPDLSYSVYGLIKNGYSAKAIGTMEANLRDIVRSNSVFAEQYKSTKDGAILPDGVFPSLFGAATIIDFCLLLNGYKYDEGFPQAIIPGKSRGGVENILIKNKVLNLYVDGEAQKIKVTGSYLQYDNEFETEVGKVVAIR